MAYLQWYTISGGSQPPSPKLTPEEKLRWRNSRHPMSSPGLWEANSVGPAARAGKMYALLNTPMTCMADNIGPVAATPTPTALMPC